MGPSLDIQSDPPIALVDIPALLPKRHGKKVHHSTVYRWATKGARGRVLESRLIGGVRYTSITALNRFLQPAMRHADGERRTVIKQVLYGES